MLPIAVGFGISNKERVDQIRSFVDVVIVGSAIIDLVNKSKTENLEINVKDFLKQMRL